VIPVLDLMSRPRAGGSTPTVVVLGAHCDDIEIGAGGLLLHLAARFPGLQVVAAVLTSTAEREAETRAALADFLPGARLQLAVHRLPDGRLPAHWDWVKEVVEETRRSADGLGGADLVLAPSRHDAHQDHRTVAELTPTAFRDPLILQYEILKSDGDLARPNVYVPLPVEWAQRKCDLLRKHYGSQQHRAWFDEEAFLGLLRIRGVECHTRYAEAFSCSKVIVGLPPDDPNREQQDAGPPADR